MAHQYIEMQSFEVPYFGRLKLLQKHIGTLSKKWHIPCANQETNVFQVTDKIAAMAHCGTLGSITKGPHLNQL